MENQSHVSTQILSEEAIRRALVEQWGLVDVAELTQVKKADDGRALWRVSTPTGDYALKVYASTRNLDTIKKDIQMLRFLAETDVPACRLQDTKNGDGYGTIEGRYAYVYVWIEGEHPVSTPEIFEKLGMAAGRLHTGSENYPVASDFLPTEEIKKRIQFATDRGIDPRYIELLRSIRDIQHLPQGIIHTDLGPHNVLRCPDGNIVIIDWEDAGRGPRIIDLGWLLEQCLSDECVFQTEQAQALMRGYVQYQMLTSEEIDHLYDAVLFFALLYWASEGGLKEFGRKRIDWFASHSEIFKEVLQKS